MIRNKKGFTLIELIIVMAIIGILAVVAVIAIGSKSAEARDARRLADMAAVRTAMALSCSEGESLSLTNIGVNTSVRPVICQTAGSSYLTFTNVQDPDGGVTCAVGTVGCAQDAAGVCDYAYGVPATGVAFADAATAISSMVTNGGCNYRINFYQEGGDGPGYASDEGLVE